jgi:hypothetical protein
MGIKLHNCKGITKAGEAPPHNSVECEDFRILSATAPLYITGPLTKLSAGPKLGEVLLSLSMPMKPGKPENADCPAVLKAAQQRYQTSRP